VTQILVTRGAGFIESNFVHATRRDRPGAAVTVLDAGLLPQYDDARKWICALESRIAEPVIVRRSSGARR